MKSIATFALLCPWLVAQGQAPAPQATAETAKLALRAAFADPDFVLFDQPQADGPLWTVGRNFKASFDRDGVTFFGFPKPEAPSMQALRFTVAGATVGGSPLAVEPGAPVRTDRRVEWSRGGLIETIDVAGHGIEQTFTFPRLPRRGELAVEIAVDTWLTASASTDGIRFHGPYDDVTYSQAIAIDARGGRLAVPTTFVDGRIAIRVPAAFVERAALPLRIDPWITAIPVANDTFDLGDPDVAWDVASSAWGVVYSRRLSASDWDCYVQRIADGNPMQSIGGPIPIDVTISAWERPRIANLHQVSEFGVVAQVRNAGRQTEVWSRLITNAGTAVTGQFVVAAGAFHEIHPDIGGDSTTEPRAAFFTVVWEHAGTSADHDILATQLFPTGGAGNVVVIQADARNQTYPAISKSAGGGPSGSQRFAIVYQQTKTANDEDIWGSMLFWNGNQVVVNGSTTFPIDVSSNNDVRPTVSSPTLPSADGTRRLLAVYERTNAGAGDIAATCFDQDGNLGARGNVSLLEGDATRRPWPQVRPSVESDGDRFFVAYHELFNGNVSANDLDTHMALVGIGTNGLLVEEHATLADGQEAEFNVRVASRYSGSGLRGPRACTVHDRDGPRTAHGIDAYTYDGLPAPSFRTRATGCGNLVITPSGGTMLGNAMAFGLGSGNNLAGFVAGFAAQAPLSFCPVCTLGVNGQSLFGSSMQIAIPLDATFLGVQVAVQGFMLAVTGPCIGRVHLSDTIDFYVQ
jgi:hypothetical protein